MSDFGEDLGKNKKLVVREVGFALERRGNRRIFELSMLNRSRIV